MNNIKEKRSKRNSEKLLAIVNERQLTLADSLSSSSSQLQSALVSSTSGKSALVVAAVTSKGGGGGSSSSSSSSSSGSSSSGSVVIPSIQLSGWLFLSLSPLITDGTFVKTRPGGEADSGVVMIMMIAITHILYIYIYIDIYVCAYT